MAAKSSEITASPALLEWLDLKANIITINAMGCQWSIAEEILKKEGNYIFSLKRNQGILHDDVKKYLSDADVIKALKPHKNLEKGHGRIETCTCWVSYDVSWLQEMHPR